MKDDSLSLALVASLAIHCVVILLTSIVIRDTGNFRRENYLPVNLVEIPPTAEVTPVKEPESPPEIVKPPTPPPHKIEKAQPRKPPVKPQPIQPEPAPPVLPKEEPPKPVEQKPPPANLEGPVPNAPTARIEGGGSEADAGNLLDKGDVGVVAGTSTALSGLGRGAGDQGLPAPTTPLRTNREARPIQTVRAAYPPIALRMGMESDVTLKIEVDTEGKVTSAEIIKSGGTGFDDEALKAVKKSRFEPARKDGRNVPAEFTYIYRFRLRR